MFCFYGGKNYKNA